MRAEFANGRDYSCADGLGERIVDALPNFLPQVRALRLPAVQVGLTGGGLHGQSLACWWRKVTLKHIALYN